MNVPEKPIGWVYFIHDEERNAVKIGYAGDFDKRLMDLQTGNPCELHIEYFIRGTPRLEKALQLRFEHLSLGREWFRICEEIRGFVDTLEGLKRAHVERLIRSGILTVKTVEDVYRALDQALLPEPTILSVEVEYIG